MSAESSPPILQQETPESLLPKLRAMGLDAQDVEARRLVSHVTQRFHQSVAGVRGVRARVRDTVEAQWKVGELELVEVQRSRVDPFVKYVFRLPDGLQVEAVRIPLHKAGRFSVCVSSQAGCAMGCRFCATGTLGLQRNLSTWEIVEQVRYIAREISEEKLGRVHGVVFQGMGEPLQNYDAVLGALRILTHPCGLAIDARRITVCTVGIIPGIDRLAADMPKVRLGLSITSARPAVRRSLVPQEGRYSLDELVEAVKRYEAASGYLVMFAFALLGGVNTTEEEAEAIAALVERTRARLSLIDWNPVEGLPFRPPTEQERLHFEDRLRSLGVPVVRRYSGGPDIDAACGQLVAGGEARSEALERAQASASQLVTLSTQPRNQK